MVKRYSVDYVAGGATLNSIRVAQVDHPVLPQIICILLLNMSLVFYNVDYMLGLISQLYVKLLGFHIF